MLLPQHRQYDNQTQPNTLEYKTNFEAHIARDVSTSLCQYVILCSKKRLVVKTQKKCSDIQKIMYQFNAAQNTKNIIVWDFNSQYLLF